MALPLDGYVEALASVNLSTHPWAGTPDLEPVGAAYVDLCNALANFLDEARAEGSIGYAEARSTAQQLVGVLPKTEIPSALDLLHGLALALNAEGATNV